MKNSANTYGKISRFLHWGNAVLLLIVWIASEFDDDGILFYWSHMQLGIAAFFLTLVQILWNFIDKTPKELPEMPKWRRIAIDWNHKLILLVALLGSGTGFFLWKTDQFEDMHEIFGTALVFLFIMHVAGTFLYQFTKGNTLARMGIKNLKK
jgi:cytochrome b561